MDEKKINPLTIVFMIAQLGFFIILAFVFYQISTGPYIKDVQGNYVNRPEIKIAGLDKESLDLVDDDIDHIQERVFDVVLYNTLNVSKDIKGEIREGSIRNIYFERQGYNYLRAILDIPEIEQSYEFFYTHPGLGEDIYHIGVNDTIFILCLDASEASKYPNFKCKNYPYMPERTVLGAEFLQQGFYFDNFSVYVEPADFSRIIISPVVTYKNDDAMEKRYISEVKLALESLGISPDIFTYYVWSADDIDYSN